MKIINPGNEDYHIHSINFSDGWNTIDEIVRYAGDIGLTKIAICDHSEVLLKSEGYGKKTGRFPFKRWKNVFNNVEVIFGVEADLLNDSGDVCMEIDGYEGDFVLLSYHKEVFQATSKQIAAGFLAAMNRYHDRIDCIGHVCIGLDVADTKAVILAANEYNIPLELNAKYFVQNPPKWIVLLDNADRLYVNSDAHILTDLRDFRNTAFHLLKEMKYIKQ
jgi:histidinol phosphatase-like PHP family hydrolase